MTIFGILPNISVAARSCSLLHNRSHCRISLQCPSRAKLQTRGRSRRTRRCLCIVALCVSYQSPPDRSILALRIACADGFQTHPFSYACHLAFGGYRKGVLSTASYCQEDLNLPRRSLSDGFYAPA